MGIFYDLNEIIVQQAIEDAQYHEVKDAYYEYCNKNGFTYTIECWSIFRDLFIEKRDILNSVRGIYDYYTYTICRTFKDDSERSREAYSFHENPEQLSTNMMNIAKDIIEKHG